MARISKEQFLSTLHDDALKQFNDIQTALRDERLQCLQDRRFYSLCGAQWEGPLWDQYENKPKFEVNKIMLSVIRIVNEYRNNRITVDYVSKDGIRVNFRRPVLKRIDCKRIAQFCDNQKLSVCGHPIAVYPNGIENRSQIGVGVLRQR